jgi:hypothetical protein
LNSAIPNIIKIEEKEINFNESVIDNTNDNNSVFINNNDINSNGKCNNNNNNEKGIASAEQFNTCLNLL